MTRDELLELSARAIEGGACDEDVRAFWVASCSSAEEGAAIENIERALAAILGERVDCSLMKPDRRMSNLSPSEKRLWNAASDRDDLLTGLVF